MESSAFAEGGAPPVHEDLSVVFKSIALMVIICAGAIQNAAIVCAIVKDRRLHRAPYYFVVNLVISDLLRSVICLPFVQASAIHGPAWQYGSPACKLLAFASTFFVLGALFALLVLALDRYLSVVHRKLHATRLSGVLCLSMALIGWTAAFVLAFPPIFGFGSHGSRPPGDRCAFERRSGDSDDALVFVVGFLVASSLTLFVYGRILLHFRRRRRMKPVLLRPPRSEGWDFIRPPPGVILAGPPLRGTPLSPTRTQRVPMECQVPTQQPLQDYYIPLQVVNTRPTAGPTQNTPHCEGENRQQHGMASGEQLTRASFTVTLFYDVIWLPYVVMICWNMVHVDHVVPHEYVTVATWFTYCQVAVLPLVYVLSHRPVGRHVLGTTNANVDCSGENPRPLLSVDA